jgi:hypothetical protein
MSVCADEGAYCRAECGGTGFCKSDQVGFGYKVCLCIQKNTSSADFLTTGSRHMVQVDPPVIDPGGVNTFTFQDTSQMDAMKFLFGDGSAIDSLQGGASGHMTILFDNVYDPPIPGWVLEFQLDFPSYDLFGSPTGMNHWELDPGSYFAEVVYDFHHGELWVQSEQTLVILAGNEIFPARPAWMGMGIVDSGRGRWSFILTESEEITGATPVPPVQTETWGTIKSIYR